MAVATFDNLPDIPAIRELKTHAQWVAWKYATRTNADGTTFPTKAPVNPHTNHNAKSSKPRTWGTFEQAVKCAQCCGHAGIGYMLAENDDISGGDFDKVRDPATGELPDWAQEIVDLGETYTEISPSGTGVRMFWRGKLPGNKAIKCDPAGVEIYSARRYLTITGNRIAGTPDTICPAPKTLALLQARVDKFKAAKAATKARIKTNGQQPPQSVKSRAKFGAKSERNPFWRAVNDMALSRLDAWVPNIFGAAARLYATGAYRITSNDLGRDLQEDLSIHPSGIQDFGTEEESLTAIDLVQRYANVNGVKAAALWLCDACGVDPETLGFDPDHHKGLKLIDTPPPGVIKLAAPKQPRGPLADEARATLRKHLSEFVGHALHRHAMWMELERIANDDAEFATSIGNNNFDLDAKRAELQASFEHLNINLKGPHHANRITTGIGKSELLRHAVSYEYIPVAKSEGFPHRVLKLVPTHKLGEEAASKLPDGVTTMVWQGRGAIKLGTTDEPMCRNPASVKAAIDIGANVEQTACKSKSAKCPFFETCHYQQQKTAARTADIVYAAHEILFQAPKALGTFGLVVIDEGFWQDGIATKARLVVESLAAEIDEFPVLDFDDERLAHETMRLRTLLEMLQGALGEMPDGYVQRQPLIDAGFQRATASEASSCKAAHKLEWARKIKKTAMLRPDADDEARSGAVKKFGFFGRLPRRAAMWRALDELIAGDEDATGRLKLETVDTADGPMRYLRILGAKKIAEKLLDLPIMVADATLPFGIVEHFLPDLVLTLDLEVEAPHQKVMQIAGLPVGKSSLQALEPGKRKGNKEAEVAHKRQRLADTCHILIQHRRGLVVTYKSIEQDFAGNPGTDTGHFNAIEGVDRWKEVDALVTIGRPLPKQEDIQDMAAAVTGMPVIAGPTVQEYRPLGPKHLLRCRLYGDPSAEMIRRAVSEAAIEQAVGRARGVNRTAANPVEIFVILGNTVVQGLPIDEVVAFQDIEPDAVDLMAMRGLIPQSPTDAAEIHWDLFPSAGAAKKVFQRIGLCVETGTRLRHKQAHTGTTLYKKSLMKGCPRVARYCRRGARQRPRLIRFDPAVFPNLRATLEAILGPLVLFEILEEPGQAQVYRAAE